LNNFRIFGFWGAFLIACIFLWPGVGFSQEDIKPNATRPSVADNAYLTHLGYTELEFGFTYLQNFWSLPLLLKFSFHQNFELGFTMSGLIDHTEEDTNFGISGLQLKTQFLDRDWGALAGVARIESIEKTKPVVTVYGVTSLLLKIGQLDGTFGGVFSEQGDSGYSESFVYAVALSPSLNSPIGTYLEIFGVSSAFSNPFYFDCGISYPLSKRIIIDAAITFGLNGDADSWIFQIGFTSLLLKVF